MDLLGVQPFGRHAPFVRGWWLSERWFIASGRRDHNPGDHALPPG